MKSAPVKAKKTKPVKEKSDAVFPPAATFTAPSASSSALPPVSDLPPIGGGGDFPPVGGGRGGFGGGLGSLGMRQGGFEYDEQARRRANAELAKMNAQFDKHLDFEEEKKDEDKRSMMEVMQAKRQ